MTPAARVQAAIDCLDAIIAAARAGGAAADTLIQRYFAQRRYAGAKDRRAVRDLVFAAIRSLGEVPHSGRAAMIGHARAHDPAVLALFGARGHAPAALVPGEPEATPGPAPAWLMDRLRARFGADLDAEVAALLERAPLDLRVNRLKASREAALARLDGFVPTPRAPDGLRAAVPIAIEELPAFVDGWVEVQDEGSQLAALAVGAGPDDLVVDLCAGGGGKTLALAAMMADRGRLVATDADRGRLAGLPPRLVRAGVTIVETRLLDARHEAARLEDLVGQASHVLVDAPCSGSGTWRRNPEARWRLTPERLARLTSEQDRLLALAATLVRPGGVLVYVTCSLLPEEGDARMDAFAATHPDFAPDPFRLPGGGSAGARRVLTPRRDGCDGFFIARSRRLC